MTGRVKRHVGFVALVLLLGAAPVFSVLIASLVASYGGCELHEGFANACVIGGVDFGETLYAMGVAGWLGLVTIPLSILVLAAYLVVSVIMAVIRQRRPGGVPPTGAGSSQAAGP